jgi:uncharacterized membrane protein YhiD involved in acid resistance
MSEPILGVGGATSPPTAPSSAGVEILFDGWSDFANGWLLLDMVLVLVIALALGALIAYHPSTRKRATSLELWEQPKTLLMYSMVAAVVALIVQVLPAMALVVFGIGGLLRFRTIVGEAHDTGRVILVTVMGLCCGLKLYVVAVPAAIIGWIVVYLLETQRIGIIRVTGVEDTAVHHAIAAYREMLVAAGCEIVGTESRFVKREFSFVVKVPDELNTDELKEQLDTLPEQLRGVVAFDRL